MIGGIPPTDRTGDIHTVAWAWCLVFDDLGCKYGNLHQDTPSIYLAHIQILHASKLYYMYT
jgi:hypothetical protein